MNIIKSEFRAWRIVQFEAESLCGEVICLRCTLMSQKPHFCENVCETCQSLQDMKNGTFVYQLTTGKKTDCILQRLFLYQASEEWCQIYREWKVAFLKKKFLSVFSCHRCWLPQFPVTGELFEDNARELVLIESILSSIQYLQHRVNDSYANIAGCRIGVELWSLWIFLLLGNVFWLWLCDVIWCGVMWCVVMWHNVMWCDMMGCDMKWCDMMWCHMMWYDVT